MVFGKFKNYPIFRYIIYDFLKKVSRGSRPTCLAKILCAEVSDQGPGTRSSPGVCGGGREGAGGGAGDAGEGARAPHSGLV